MRLSKTAIAGAVAVKSNAANNIIKWKLVRENYPNERIISLWIMRLILSYYKFKNGSQNVCYLFLCGEDSQSWVKRLKTNQVFASF